MKRARIMFVLCLIMVFLLTSSVVFAKGNNLVFKGSTDNLGIYGPASGVDIHNGNIELKITENLGYKFQNMVVEGDFNIVGEADGLVILHNIIVKGNISIIGRGDIRVEFRNSTIPYIFVNKTEGKTHLLTYGKTNVDEVVIECNMPVILEGAFKKVVVADKDCGSSAHLLIHEKATIDELVLNRCANITGQGFVKIVYFNASGTTMERFPFT